MNANLEGGLSLPIGEQEAKPAVFVGQILNVRPAVKRVSRRALYRGYAIDVVREVEDGEVVRTETVFRPKFRYDVAIANPSRY